MRPGFRLRACCVVLTLALGCIGGGPSPVEACIEIEASPNLNLYDGQAHAVTVLLFPLASSLDFEQASVRDLLDGTTPTGSAGSPIPVTIRPGETRKIEESLPSTATYVGVVADYYREPGDPEGSRRAVLPAKCGFFPPTITLSAQDLLTN